MNLELELGIRRELVRYLAGEVALADLRNWFDAETWGAGSGLSADVDLLFAEYSSGDWTEEELRLRLRNLTATLFATQQQWGTSGVVMTTGTSTSSVQLPSGSIVDIRPAVVFG